MVISVNAEATGKEITASIRRSMSLIDPKRSIAKGSFWELEPHRCNWIVSRLPI